MSVVMYQANRAPWVRTKTKSRGMKFAGSTKKMYRQKGTGNARAGSKQAAASVAAAVTCFRSRSTAIIRIACRSKALQAATRMALASQGPRFARIDHASTNCRMARNRRPRKWSRSSSTWALKAGSLLVTTAAYDANVYRSGRNLPGVLISPAGEIQEHTASSVRSE